MSVFNYISVLRSNCIPAEDCATEDCQKYPPNPCIYDVFPPGCLALVDDALEVELVISGITQGTCEDDCTAANGTHLYGTAAPDQFWNVLPPNYCYVYGGRFIGCSTIGYGIGLSGGEYVLGAYANSLWHTISWLLTGSDALDAFAALCNGEGPIELPSDQDTGDYCNGPGACTINFL